MVLNYKIMSEKMYVNLVIVLTQLLSETRLAPVLKTVFLFMCLGASLIYILVASLILMLYGQLEMGFLKKKINFTIEFFFFP